MTGHTEPDALPRSCPCPGRAGWCLQCFSELPPLVRDQVRAAAGVRGRSGCARPERGSPRWTA